MDPNTATNGVFAINGSADVAMSGIEIRHGVGGSGGGISITNPGILTLTECSVRANKASGNGGGIYNNGTLTLRRCTVSSGTRPATSTTRPRSSILCWTTAAGP